MAHARNNKGSVRWMYLILTERHPACRRGITPGTSSRLSEFAAMSYL